jgi:hypothetical protein
MDIDTWAIFTDRLFDELGRDLPGNCDGTLSKSQAILERMGEDAPNALAYCQKHGGFCDCEVLFSVVAPTRS